MTDSWMRGAGVSLEQLQGEAAPNRDWRDNLNWIFGNDLTTKTNYDWSQREIDSNGRVVQTNFDKLIGRDETELQAAYEKWRQGKLKSSPQAAQYELTFGEQIPTDNLHQQSTLSIARKVKGEKDRIADVKPLKSALLTLDGGTEALAALGDKPTADDVSGAITRIKEARKKDPNIRGSDAWYEKKEEEAELKEDRLREERRAERRDERAYQDARLEYLEQKDAADRAYNSKRDDLKFGHELTIAQMNQADRAADRRYQREDRLALQRQQSIANLIKGLTQLGAGFAI